MTHKTVPILILILVISLFVDVGQTQIKRTLEERVEILEKEVLELKKDIRDLEKKSAQIPEKIGVYQTDSPAITEIKKRVVEAEKKALAEQEYNSPKEVYIRMLQSNYGATREHAEKLWEEKIKKEQELLDRQKRINQQRSRIGRGTDQIRINRSDLNQRDPIK